MKKQFRIIEIVALLVCVCLSGCSDTNQHPGPFYVGYGSDADYHTIQEAIDAAKNGDIIIIKNGTYNELINISKKITLIGEDKNTTIINFSQDYEITSSVSIMTISVDNCSIENLQITHSNNALIVQGISINSKYNTIKNSIITNVTNGIMLSAYSELNTIIYNEIKNNQIGIDAISSAHNNISYNTFSNNSQYNIYFKTDSDTNIVSFNTMENSFYGMRIKGSDRNTIYKNCIENNDVGIYFCCGSKSNSVYSNTFLHNFQGNAEEDKGLTNIWYDYPNGPGNYWDNYTGSDENQDGIGDTPYVIPRMGNQDSYPLMTPPLDAPCNQ